MSSPSTGERDLSKLLAQLRPQLQGGEFVFVSLPTNRAIPATAVATIVESEGISAVVPVATADALGLAYSFTYSWITLRVHSSLEAVGLTAAVAVALANRSIACNVVAGFYHDHLFVPYDRETDALEALANMVPPA